MVQILNEGLTSVCYKHSSHYNSLNTQKESYFTLKTQMACLSLLFLSKVPLLGPLVQYLIQFYLWLSHESLRFFMVSVTIVFDNHDLFECNNCLCNHWPMHLQIMTSSFVNWLMSILMQDNLFICYLQYSIITCIFAINS